MKNFRKEIQKIKEKIEAKETFAFSKFADGELKILQGKHIDLTKKANGEFVYRPDNKDDQFYKSKLTESLQFQHQDYYVGICCPCCLKIEDAEWMRKKCQQDSDHQTYANIWVNSNYPYYQKEVVPLFKSYDEIVVVCNHKAKIKGLPFKDNIIKDFRVGTNAWRNDYKLVDEIKKWIESQKIQGALFLFMAGPFGNILTHQLFKSFPSNTYLDVGSTLDPYAGLGKYRGYLRGSKTLKKVCTWFK